MIMVNLNAVQRVLQRESHYWKRQAPTPHINGIIHGLRLALNEVKTVRTYKVSLKALNFPVRNQEL